ncbi:MAG: low molecular weight protein-tyrosine-phosphatase [Candidatus Nanopelagicales bacterium]
MPYLITAVCLGNICRSPMAEAVLRRRFDDAGLGADVVVDSAGTGGWHVGADADPRALATLAAAGYDLRHSARRFQPEWLERSDLVLAMDRDNYDALLELAERHDVPIEHVRMLRSFDPEASANADVPDPYYGGADGFHDVLAMIERAADGVVQFVAAELRS